MRRPRWDAEAGPARAAALGVVGIALALRVVRLDRPGVPLVDEAYYVPGARALLDLGREPSYLAPVAGQLPAVHPPLGKWAIALGMLVAGDHPFGWRIAAALAGTATVALVYLLGRRLFGSRLVGLLAAFLLAIEHLSVVQSRTAMLDVFVTLWIVAGAYALVRDTDAAGAHLRARASPEPPPVDGPGAATATAPRWDARVTRRRTWRAAAGLALGLACATKWSAVSVLPVAWTVALAAEARLGRDLGHPSPWRRALVDELPSVIGWLVLAPVAVYVASYAGAFAAGQGLAGWWEDQVRMATFHTRVRTGHPYASGPLSWLLARRSMAYFFARPTLATPDGPAPGVQEVLAFGHPLLVWAILPTAAWATARWLRHGDQGLGFALVFGLALWAPWLLVDRTMFVFYLTPVLPFALLLEAAALRRLAASRAGRAAVLVLLAAAVALLWFHWPVLTGVPLTQEAWHLRVPAWRELPLLRPNWV